MPIYRFIFFTDDFWTKNTLTGMYYQVNKESALTWYQARKSCQQQGGDLASITEIHEQTQISGTIWYVNKKNLLQ